MTDTQRVTDDMLDYWCRCYPDGEYKAGTDSGRVMQLSHDLRDARALAQSQAVTIAELRAEVERLGSDVRKWRTQSNEWLETANKLNSALATANAQIEKLKAVAAAANDLHQQMYKAFPGLREGTLERLREALAALQEDKPHG